MKILYQWALKNPTDWQEIDAKDWHTLAKRPIPKKGELGGLDNTSGWIRNVNVQGLTTEGYDHIAIESIMIGNDEGVKLTTWNDDPEDWPPGKRSAIVWTILPLAPDPKLGMAINTRQSCVRYYEGETYSRYFPSDTSPRLGNWFRHAPQNTTIRPFAEFVPPHEDVVRHGVWLEQGKHKEHKVVAPQGKFGWMHWNEHLPDSECELDKNGKRVLKEQRKQGRYRQAEHTITYYQKTTDNANPVATCTHEDALESTTAGSATESVTTDSGLVEAWSFLGPVVGVDFPSGVYHAQLNCTAASGGLVYGISDTASTGGFFALGTGVPKNYIDSWNPSNGNGDSNDFSGTGLKLATSGTFDSAGISTSKFGFVVSATGDSHGDAITLQLNTTDSYADGPWTTSAFIARQGLSINQTINRSRTY